MKNLRHILILAGLLAAPALPAQDLSTEITVDRTVVPRRDIASPMQSVQPSVLSTDAPSVRLDPDDLTSVPPYEPQPGFSATNPTSTPDSSAYRVYVLGGYFPAHNYALRGGINLVRRRNTTFDVHAGLRGYSYKGWTGFDGAKATLMRPYAEFDFFHAFRPTTLLEVRAGASIDRLSDSPRLGADLYHGVSRANVDGRLTAHIHSYKASIELKYNLIAVSDPLDTDSEAYSSIISLGGALTPASGTGWDVALEAAAQMRRGVPQFAEYFVRNTCAIVSLTPGYSLTTSGFDIHAGVRLDGTFGGGEGAFHASPRLEASTTLLKRLHAKLDVAGGEYFNSSARCYAYSPFAVQQYLFSNSYCPVDAKLSLTFGPADWGSLSIYGRYSRTNDVPMPMIMRNQLTWERVDLHGFTGGAKLDLTPFKWLTAGADAVFTPEGLHQGVADNIDRARFQVNAHITATPYRGFHVGVSYHLRAGRAFYATDPMSTFRQPIGNISDLRFHIGCRITDPLTVFLKLDNILNRRPELLPGLRTRGIHGLVGAIYRF